MKTKVLLVLLPFISLVSCNLFKSENEQRKDVIIESMKYLEAGDTSNFLDLFAETNLIKDSSVLLTHFTMAGALIRKFGMPGENKIEFKPLEGGVGELGTRAIVNFLTESASADSVAVLRLEYVFLNNNPEAKNFIDFRLSTGHAN